MLYESYRENLVYSGQSKFNFPRRGNSETAGFGAAVFLMCPNRTKSLEVVRDPVMNFIPSLIKRYVTDTMYREKIGTKRVVSLERANTDRLYTGMQDFPLYYIPTASRNAVLSKHKNVVNDISRWMEIFFARTDNLPTKKKCGEFIRILKGRLNDPAFRGYEKVLIFDLNSWTSTIKNCVVMNKKLLNNPLSILLFSACFYPEFLEDFPDIRLMIINRASGQLYITKTSFLTKKNYPKIKAKLGVFKSLIFSVEDDVAPIEEQDNVDAEVKAEILNAFKDEIKNRLRYQLLGANSADDPFENIEDITGEVADPFDELEKELSDAEVDEVPVPEGPAPKTVEDTPKIEESIEDTLDLDEEINKEVEEELETVEDIDDLDPEEIVLSLTDKIKSNRYKASFVPTRTKAEIAKIERLTAGQQKVLSLPSLDDVKRKTLTTTTTGGYIKTTNPNILSSKFANFDKEYTEKCLEKDIDRSVAILSNASSKIFVTDKTVTDSSTPMDLKQTYTYRLQDEKGNRMSLVFDVPKVIDGSYVYLNGTKKNIRHQFILKPIVKTGPDTVQLVTAYNKVFIRRQGVVNQNINRIQNFLEKNPGEFEIRSGNCTMRNGEYEVPLDFSMLSRYFSEFTIRGVRYYMAIDTLKEQYKKMKRKDLVYDATKEIPIGIDLEKKDVVMLDLTQSYSEAIFKAFTEEDQKRIAKIKRKPKFVVANAKIMKRNLPLVLFMMFCEGFANVMKKANIKYEFVDKKTKNTYDPMKYDTIEMADGFIVWEKTPFRNELLMNGFKKCDLTPYNFEDLENKDTFISLILPFYPGNYKIYDALDNYRDFLLDEKTKEILTDFGYPTDLISLLVVAAGMLTDTNYIIENNMNNMRIRSNEVIADLVYITVTKAYEQYRATSYKKRPTKLSVKPSIIIDKLLDSDTNMIEEFSSLNPVLELEKQRAVTFKGIRGIQMDRAMTLPRRCYDKSMLGIVGITTSPDSNCGVNRQLTLEPNVTSTYGYLDATKGDNPEELNAANLFTVAELVQPLGVMHDDPDRTSMSYKQTKFMLPVQDADPVLIGNKVEATVPYLLSDEFIVTAKEDGKVVEISDGFCIVEYKSGKKYAVNIAPRARKNSSAGFWINNTLVCKYKVGDKFKEGDILAYNDKHFSPNKEDRGASMNLGALAKIAISSQWDVFEDSAPISKRLSEKLATEIIDEKHVTFSAYTHIDKIVKVGDQIKAGDPLVVFSDAQDKEMSVLLAKMRENSSQAVIESSKTSIASKYTGEVVDIKIYTTGELNILDPSLQKLIKDYWSRIRKKNALLKKHQNPDDLEYYKLGQVINEVDEVITPNRASKVSGYIMNPDEVMILFYVKYQVAASKGDKVVCSVCKGIISHVFEEGLEPYSEYRPDEPIDTIVAPLAVAARKVPAIFLTIFGNKLLIELKNQVRELYLE